jgi:DNA-binding IclR family transcriptional regulator
MDSQSGTRAITRALEALCCFSSLRQEWGISEMADYLGYSRSVIHRILTTLERERFVTRTPSHRYRLGNRALELGQTSRVANRLVWEAEPRLDVLANDVQGVVHLAIMEGREVVELARSMSRRVLTPSAQPRFRMPAHATALGKVLLAYAPPETRERFFSMRRQLPKYTEKTICNPAVLHSHLQTIAAQGYSLDDEECKVGYRCLAVPVYDGQDRLLAALSVSKKSGPLSEPETHLLLKHMLLTARSLSPH